MTLTPLDQKFLDLMDRIEQIQQDQIIALTRRLTTIELQNQSLQSRLRELEDAMDRQSGALSSLNTMLEKFLAPSGSPPPSHMSLDG